MKLIILNVLLISFGIFPSAYSVQVQQKSSITKKNPNNEVYYSIYRSLLVDVTSDNNTIVDYLNEAQGLDPEWIYQRNGDSLQMLGSQVADFKCYLFPNSEDRITPTVDSVDVPCFDTVVPPDHYVFFWNASYLE